MRPVEGEDIKPLLVHHHVLAVVSHQIVSGTRHLDSCAQQAKFERSQALFTRAIHTSDQGAYRDAASNRLLQRLLDLFLIKAEDRNIDALSCGGNAFQDSPHSIAWLNQQLFR